VDQFIDWIVEAVADWFGDLFLDRKGRGRTRRRIGSRWTAVPELRDLSIAEAREALTRAGLRMTVVQQAAGAEPASGRVLSQDPPPWRAVRRRHKVTVRI
jgi:hypothetical protein